MMEDVPQAYTLPLYAPMSFWICDTITSCNFVLSVMELTHVGNCECQTVVWPRTSWLLVVAQSTKKSALPRVS